ncbi:MAG TPA: hypothetical protein PK671_06870 [Candidatus Obscuribacter sp.]|nr:hypothetical protein [Candidatus Obscuribacter sp.]
MASPGDNAEASTVQDRRLDAGQKSGEAAGGKNSLDLLALALGEKPLSTAASASPATAQAHLDQGSSLKPGLASPGLATISASGETSLGGGGTGAPVSNGEIAAMAWDTAAAVPGKAVDTLTADLKDDKSAVLGRLFQGALIGAGTTAVMRFAPRLGYVGGAVLLADQLYGSAKGLGGFVDQARATTSASERQTLVEQSSQKMGTSLAHMAEGAPGLIAGGYMATRYVGTPLLYTRIGISATEKVVDPLRNRLAFMGPGTERLPMGLVEKTAQSTKVDAYGLLQKLSDHPSHSWAGIETGRAVDLATMKLSRPVSGTELRLPTLPAPNKADALTFHTHKPGRGAYPGQDDLLSTRSIGLISSGTEKGVFLGERGQVLDLLRRGAGGSYVPTLRAVVIDESAGTANRLVGTWDRGAKHWLLTERSHLDYSATIEALRNLDTTRAWQALSQIPRVQTGAGF